MSCKILISRENLTERNTDATKTTRGENYEQRKLRAAKIKRGKNSGLQKFREAKFSGGENYQEEITGGEIFRCVIMMDN